MLGFLLLLFIGAKVEQEVRKREDGDVTATETRGSRRRQWRRIRTLLSVTEANIEYLIGKNKRKKNKGELMQDEERWPILWWLLLVRPP